jgi:hypothetical protein
MDELMNSLQVLNATLAEKERGADVPICLQILLDGQWHTVSVDRNDRDAQKAARVLVMMMLRSELGQTAKGETLSDYTVRVRVGGVCEEVDVKTYSSLDARVMAYILKGNIPDDACQALIISLAQANTEIVYQWIN